MATADQYKKVAEFLQNEKIGFRIFGSEEPGTYGIAGVPTLTPNGRRVDHVDIVPENHGMYLPYKTIDEIYELLIGDPTTRIALW